MEWLTVVSPFICFGFVIWIYAYFKNCYINKLINELQELNDTLLDIGDTLNNISDNL